MNNCVRLLLYVQLLIPYQLLTIPLTHFSAGGFPFLLGVFWLDILFGCAPVLPSDWPSLMSLACLKSPCPAPLPPLPPPRPRWFGCLREVWGLATRRKREQTREVKLCTSSTHSTRAHTLTQLNLMLRQGSVSLWRAQCHRWFDICRRCRSDEQHNASQQQHNIAN